MRKAVAITAVAMVFYFVLVVLSDVEEVGNAFQSFEWIYLAPTLVLVVLNYLVRAERWHSFLGRIDLSLPRKRSYQLFMAGLSMSITPAKAGEAMKALFLRIEKESPLERGIAVVFAERMTDLTGIMFLVGIGFIAFPYGLLSFVAVLALVILVLVVLATPGLSHRLVGWLKSKRLFNRIGVMAESGLHDARSLLAGRSLVKGTVLGLVAWSAECVAFYCILVGCSLDIAILEAVFVYSFASVVGAVSLMPGGMGTTEATMIGLLVLLSASAPMASFVVILTRVCTLWFAVGLGLIFLVYYSKRSGQADPLAT
jgi:uncharacterized protein (TIRG00374 family)